MPTRFLSAADPGPSVLDKLAALAPANPFATAAYLGYRRQLGARPWALGVESDEQLVSGCIAFMHVGHLNCRMEITSLPSLPHPDVFWRGLLELCARHRVSQLVVCSFGSMPTSIPQLPGEEYRQPRCEFIIDLKANDLGEHLTTHHRRLIARARKRGLRLERVADRSACDIHVSLIKASMQRREGRGEQVPNLQPSVELFAMTQSGVGELFRAVTEEETVSSMMVLRSTRGGYMQSSGTSPLGMTCGASAWLVHHVARALQSEGLELFNLGGAGPDEEGLRRFKAAFGTTPIELESASFFLGSPMKQAVTRAARRLRQAIGR